MGSVWLRAAAALIALATACTSKPVAETGRAAAAATPDPAATSPAASQASPSPTVAAKEFVVVHAVGDVNFDPVKVTGLAEHGYGHAWTGLDGLFTRDDLTIVNVECPVALGGVRQAKRFTFLCAPEGVPHMRSAGVDVATLANNHSLDFGVPSMFDSIENLRKGGIATVGAGATAADAYKPAIIERSGRRIAVIGLSQIAPRASWYAAENRPGVASGHDVKAATAAVRAAAREADDVIVTIHWGIERHTEPSKAQIALARSLIDAGADAIFGHHPHVLQPLSYYKSRPIFYSLGNFVWSRSWPASFRTGVAEVRFGKTVEARLLPAYIVSSGHPELR